MDRSQTVPRVLSFAASMPLAYRQAFDTVAVSQHAAIAERRRPRACRVEAWRDAPGALTALCLVADHGPYLQAQLAAATAAHRLDVSAARSYLRATSDGRREAIALQWIRPHAAAPRTPLDVESLGRTLDALIGGQTFLRDAIVLARDAGKTGISRSVRFQRQDPQGLSLTTTAADRPAFLLHVSQALATVRIQIVQSEAFASEGRVHDCFHLTELDGTTLAAERLLEAQTAVLGALVPPPHHVRFGLTAAINAAQRRPVASPGRAQGAAIVGVRYRV
jgi:UTP:GlnB (protein PII) uridylyltransferase